MVNIKNQLALFVILSLITLLTFSCKDEDLVLEPDNPSPTEVYDCEFVQKAL